jgi:ubiquinone/menaquinone biosynthesis C-methylase UbiE
VALAGLSDRIELRLGDATSLDFPDGAFDRVVGIECALFFDTRADFLREAARVLAPRGGLGLADVIIRAGADRDEFLKRVHYPIGTDGSLDVQENIYDLDVYAAILRDCGFESVRIEPITESTLPHFIRHVEEVARRTEDERSALWMQGAQIFREYLELGQEYVLVSARKPAADG